MESGPSDVQAVPAVHVAEHWFQVRDLLEPVIVDGGYTADFVAHALMMRQMQLWVGEAYACVTQITVRPLGNACTVLFLAGEGVKDWFSGLMDVLEDWARQNGCVMVECHGRPGWAKMGASRGYEVSGVTVRKVLNGQ